MDAGVAALYWQFAQTHDDLVAIAADIVDTGEEVQPQLIILATRPENSELQRHILAPSVARPLYDARAEGSLERFTAQLLRRGQAEYEDFVRQTRGEIPVALLQLGEVYVSTPDTQAVAQQSLGLEAGMRRAEALMLLFRFAERLVPLLHVIQTDADGKRRVRTRAFPSSAEFCGNGPMAVENAFRDPDTPLH